MVVLRALAVLFLLAAAGVAAVDLYSSLTAEGVPRLAALGSWWAWIDRDSLLVLQPAIERHLSPALWDPGIQTLLEWPLAVELAVLGAVFWLLAAWRRRARRRTAPDAPR